MNKAVSKIIEVKNISFAYLNQAKTFSNFSYEQNVRDIALWVGPSGRGKSTLAQIISGHLDAVQGEVLFNGQPINGASLQRFYVGPENDLFDWQSLRKHFEFLNRHVRSHRILSFEKLTDLTEMLEVTQLLDKHPGHISTGEMRRFQILRTLMLNPELVIFDESFSALDANLKNRLMPKLHEHWKTHGTSVIIISHESDKNFNFQFDQILDFSSLK